MLRRLPLHRRDAEALPRHRPLAFSHPRLRLLTAQAHLDAETMNAFFHRSASFIAFSSSLRRSFVGSSSQSRHFDAAVVLAHSVSLPPEQNLWKRRRSLCPVAALMTLRTWQLRNHLLLVWILITSNIIFVSLHLLLLSNGLKRIKVSLLQIILCRCLEGR